MSSFKETFTKNEKQDGNLEYDDTAFYYFFICILGMILIPLIYSTIKPLLFSSEFNQKQACKCPVCKKKLQKLKKQKRFNWMTKGYIFTFIIAVVISFLIKDCYTKITTQEQLKSFDPFEILGIDPSSTEAQIKKAYRAMTIKYHPDKNKDDPLATAKFIKITKAYECLTDPKTRAIFEKYGNPDGPGLFNVAIALPSFLMKKENHVGVLCIFFIVLLVVIPGVIFYWHSNQKKYDSDGLLVENKKLYYHLLNENMIAKSCPILISYSKEFSDEILRQRSDTEKSDLTKLWHEVKDQIAKLPKLPDELACHFLKCLILLSSYLLQLEIPQYLDTDLLYILETAPSLLEKIVVFASSFPKGYKQLKYMGLRCILVLIEFEQMVVQGLWVSDHFLSQLSYFIENDVEKFIKKARKLTNLNELLNLNIEDRKVFNSLPEESKQSINEELNYFPQLKVEYKVEVDGEEGIQQNDIITIAINFERLHINEGEEAGYVHSLRYPFIKEEYWYVIIGDADNNTIFHIQLLKDLKKSFDHKFIFPAVQPGPKHWTLYIKSDSYKGLDQQFPLDFEILPADSIKREVYVHPEDAELDHQPSFFTQIMQGMKNESEDEEEEEEANDEDKKKKKGKKNWARKQNGDEQEEQQKQEEQEQEEEEEEEAQEQ